MAFHQRKLLSLPQISERDRVDHFPSCNHTLPRLPIPPVPSTHKNGAVSPLLIPMFCVLAAAFFTVCYLTIVKKCRSNSDDLNNSMRRDPPGFDGTHEDLIDENHGPVVDHHIWFINTIGLQQSIIDSIAVFEYKKDEALTEGTECSVCLNEFQEDESLRLLPKCSHAFHIPCIDTWLRSHKNCPLCRAPVVCETAQVSTVERNLNELGSREESHEENLETSGELGSHQGGEYARSAESFGEDRRIAENLEKNTRYFSARNGENRVLSDLVNHRAKMLEELQPVKRSISMDSSSAATIYLAVSKIRPVEHEGCSDNQLVLQAKKPSSQKSSKRVNRSSSSLYRAMKSSSFGRPISMKRSLSSGRKSSRWYSRSQDSVLPL